MADLDRVRAFLEANKRSYAELLDVVRAACERVGSLIGGGSVVRVYDRRDKQAGDMLKDASKILDAAGGSCANASLKKVADIVGVTVVVQYPDQIGPFLDKLDAELSRQRVGSPKRKVHDVGYFATHATYTSLNIEHGRILCEVQCKTVLHDAWSAKMHDLTYKPLGSMDPRLRHIIEAISLSLEGLERQSQIARDMVESRQRGERKPFQAAVRLFLQAVEGLLLSASVGRVSALAGLEPLRDEVKALLAGSESTITAEAASDLSERILAALEDGETAEGAFLIAVRLASGLSEPQASRFLSDAADGLFDRLTDLKGRGLMTEEGMRAVPIGFYVIQDFPRALEYADKLLEAAPALGLSTRSIRILKFNKATWMLERESLRPSKPPIAAKTKEMVDVLLEEVRPDVPEDGRIDLLDTDGLRLIVFGESADEVRRGLEMCMAAGGPVEGDEVETALALAYAEWRNYAGWRRYFELAEREPDGV